MSIFGVKRKDVDTSSLKQEIFNIRGQLFPQINELYDGVNKMRDDHRLLYNRVEKITDKQIITICAESKGSLQHNEVFSFGNGAKEEGVGYAMNFPGQILGIGLSSKRSKGYVIVVVSINGNHQTGYDITLDVGPSGKPLGVEVGDALDSDLPDIVLSKYRNFDNPLKVEAGDTLNFVCQGSNNTCVNTVASMIIELFI